MVNALFDRGEYGYMSMHDMDCEWLRKKKHTKDVLKMQTSQKLTKL